MSGVGKLGKYIAVSAPSRGSWKLEQPPGEAASRHQSYGASLFRRNKMSMRAGSNGKHFTFNAFRGMDARWPSSQNGGSSGRGTFSTSWVATSVNSNTSRGSVFLQTGDCVFPRSNLTIQIQGRDQRRLGPPSLNGSYRIDRVGRRILSFSCVRTTWATRCRSQLRAKNGFVLAVSSADASGRICPLGLVSSSLVPPNQVGRDESPMAVAPAA